MEINSNAPVISRHEITMSAPLKSVWRVRTEIDSWPQWNPDIAKADLIGPIAVGTVFRWETAGISRLLFPNRNAEELRVVRPKLVVTARIGDYIVRTARNRALPSTTRS
jgi:hypothetical protein